VNYYHFIHDIIKTLLLAALVVYAAVNYNDRIHNEQLQKQHQQMEYKWNTNEKVYYVDNHHGNILRLYSLHRNI